MSLRISLRSVQGLLVAALAASGCGDDGSTSGGGADTTSTEATSGSTTGATTGGEGGDGPGTTTSQGSTTSSSSQGGAGTGGDGVGGGPTCEDASECDDDEPCTEDECNAGRCENTAVPDGPAEGEDDPVDCVDLVCASGALIEIPDDDEDPVDEDPPCITTICNLGAPTLNFADEGTSCGDPPLVCNGKGQCVGCDDTPGACGATTECSVPFCEDSVCNNGYTTDPPPDPNVGDCLALACPGDAAAAIVVTDNGDTPADLACTNRGCTNGSPTSTTLGFGVACLGEAGICDGLGGDSVNCKTCLDNVVGSATDAGCTNGTPLCDPTAAGGDGVCRPITTFDTTWNLPGVVFSNGNLSASGNSAGTKNIRTTVGRSAGRFYWEIRATAGDGTTNAGGHGILESIMPNSAAYIGAQASGLSFGYGTCCDDTYWTSWTGVTTNGVPPVGSAVANGIIYMFALDMDAGRFWTGQNGSWYNGGNPGTNTAPAATGITGTVYPGITFYPSSINAYTANFGNAAFIYAVPTGFVRGFY